MLAIENPIKITRVGKNTLGYEATILSDLCESILVARDNKALKTEQEHRYAEYADMLMRSLAKVGIIALVDEATGYQHEREQKELQRILKAYISEELLEWQKTFPDIFYKELFRLNGWDYTVKGIQKRPGGYRNVDKTPSFMSSCHQGFWKNWRKTFREVGLAIKQQGFFNF